MPRTPDVPARATGWTRAGRRFGHLRTACADCGSTSNVQIHHKDENPLNNAPENVVPLCVSCHRLVHIEIARTKGGHRRIASDAEVAAWVAEYNAGVVVPEIARRFGRGVMTVRTNLKRLGVYDRFRDARGQYRKVA